MKRFRNFTSTLLVGVYFLLGWLTCLISQKATNNLGEMPIFTAHGSTYSLFGMAKFLENNKKEIDSLRARIEKLEEVPTCRIVPSYKIITLPCGITNGISEKIVQVAP